MGRYDGFDEFVAAQGPALSRTAFFLTGDRGHAEDLLQDALAKAAQRWRRLADDGNPSAYVRQVMLNRSRSLWRRRRRGIEHPLAVLPEPASHADVARDVTNVAALGDALRKVGPRQRAVLYLRYYEDLSEAETARTLGCSVGTVKRQTHDALGRLRVIAPELSPIIEPSEVNE